MIECHAAIFIWFLCYFGPPSRSQVAYHVDRDRMPLHAVGVNYKKGANTENLGAGGCLLYGLWCVQDVLR